MAIGMVFLLFLIVLFVFVVTCNSTNNKKIETMDKNNNNNIPKKVSFNEKNNEYYSATSDNYNEFTVEVEEKPLMNNMNTWYNNRYIDHIDKNGSPVYNKMNSTIENTNVIVNNNKPVDYNKKLNSRGIINKPIGAIYDSFVKNIYL